MNKQPKSDRSLKAYATEGEIEVLATFEAFLHISDDRPVLLEKFYVVKENRCLLGRPTATRYSVLMLGLKVPLRIEFDRNNKDRSTENAAIASNEIFPKFNIPPVKISYDTSRPPCRNIFMNIPQAVKPIVEKRLQELVRTGIIEEVTEEMDTAFCSSMLVVPKGKDDIRLVIDLRGPNRYIQRTPFTMPTLESILGELNGACWFSTIDLSSAYFHIELDLQSRHLTNFFTEFGMFRFIRLPFGLCNAPDIFQEVLQRKILYGCKGVKNYLDDILVYGVSKSDHDEKLEIVLTHLREHNVRLNESKCVFGKSEVKFLGFLLTSNGWKIENDKIKAIKEFRKPTCCSEVKSFLGLVTFIDKFIMHRATKTEFLRRLANSDRFYWTDDEDSEFELLRNAALYSIKNLGYYSTSDKTELFVDASPTGLGAVLVQFDKNNTPRIIACASKALTETEKRYPQTHKEALAVVWGIERFSYYLMSRTFIVRTDAEANVFIFSNNHRLGKRAISRAEAWALRLQAYDYKMEKVPGIENIADALSRLIKESQEAIAFDEDEDSHFLYTLDSGCMEITWQEIETASETDNILRSLRVALENNDWPKELRKFEAHKKDIHVLGFLFFKDEKIILPKSLRIKAFISAHGGHVGEGAMKRTMRQFFWWPGLSSEVETFVKGCNTCAMLARKNPPLPIASRDLPEGPWEIIQIDFVSVPNFGSGEFLVMVDTYSRYLSVIEMKNTNLDCTNSALCDVFKLWGCPMIIQSDNGPPFQSVAFNNFWEEKGVKVRKAIPLSPRSNGSVERQNQGIIKTLSAAKLDGVNWRHALQNYVHNHNTLVPHSRLQVTPFELMVGWKFRGTFPSLWGARTSKALDSEEISGKDAEAKLISKKYEDSRHGAKESCIRVGDSVLMAQQKRSKTDPQFSSDRYKVIARDGAKVVVLSNNGVQFTRNVQELKLAPDMFDRTDESVTPVPYANTPVTQSENGTERQKLRQRNEIRKPSRFNDDFIYFVYS